MRNSKIFFQGWLDQTIIYRDPVNDCTYRVSQEEWLKFHTSMFIFICFQVQWEYQEILITLSVKNYRS
jgi:hypothetical protein